jgi:hypothetical protein
LADFVLERLGLLLDELDLLVAHIVDDRRLKVYGPFVNEIDEFVPKVIDFIG